MPYFVYILECADGTLYCGSTNNIEKRLKAHNELKSGAKYTRARRPVVLRHSEEFKTATEAKKREAAIKGLTREEKLAIIGILYL
ncbi:MAG: GIY-YIG nuclease family protein [Candidatus Pacebacteria bacterium]|nr:GIY-YIG nuclease family protein [Candidatus Paceibacterota bacterium]